MKSSKSFLQSIHNVRKVILWFAICLACVLFQTDVNNIGTISSLVILSFFYIHFFLTAKDRKYSHLAMILLVFIFLVFLISIVYNNNQKELFKFVIQALMCVCCFSLVMTDEEFMFTKIVFVVFMCFNGGMCSYSILNNPDGLFLHDSISMYGTFFDPNFVGIPFVATSVICLNEALNGRRIFYIPFVFMFSVILLTASRGSAVGFIIANGLLLVKIFSRRGKNRLLLLIITAVSVVFIYNYVFNNIFMSAENVSSLERRYEFQGADNGRFYLWGKGLKLFQEYPLFGKGLVGFYETTGHANHNTYMQVLTGTGLVGSLLFLSFIIGIGKNTFKKNYTMFCLLIGFLAQIAFLDTLSSRFLWPLLSFVIMAPRENVLTTIKRK